jgi:hypothetical protein
MMLVAITLISVVLAAIMSAIAWRASREERRRADARIAALAAEIRDEPVRLATPTTSSDLFVAPASTSVARYATVVAAGLLVCASIGALAVLTSRSGGLRANPSNLSNPLELLALGHERDGDRLTVRGVIRNPGTSGETYKLTAVVLLFSRDGAFLASGRAAVAAPDLGPGRESTFIVTVPDAGAVGRYRVSFRTDDRVVPHVDRRKST